VQEQANTTQTEPIGCNEDTLRRLTLSNEQLRELTGLGRDTILGLLRAGTIPSVRVGRRYLVTRAHVEAFLNRTR
jgi:excisionase family DNA binding protein